MRHHFTTDRSDYGVSKLRIGAFPERSAEESWCIYHRSAADISSMRSSTILLLSLRSLAHETIKNLVLAGIGRLIVMDEGNVTEEDLSGGFLFREEEGAVGKPVGQSHLLGAYLARGGIRHPSSDRRAIG